MAKKHHNRTIFISDTHLGTRGCQVDALLEFLDQNSCEYLYLVGDIIDGWQLQRSTRHFKQKHINVIQKILKMASKGTQVFYIVGNHDEILHKFVEFFDSYRFGNISFGQKFIHETADHKKLLVVHGDAYDMVTRYYRWLSVLGYLSYITLLRINHWWNSIRLRFGYDYWSLSQFLKLKVKKAVEFISEYEDSLSKVCKKDAFDGIVCRSYSYSRDS